LNLLNQDYLANRPRGTETEASDIKLNKDIGATFELKRGRVDVEE